VTNVANVGSDQVQHSPLSADQLWQFYERGYLLVGRVVDDATVDVLRRSIDLARATAGLDSDLLDAASWPDGEGGVPQEPGRNVSFLFNMWRNDQGFRDLVANPVLAEMACQVLGATQVRLLEDNALSKDPGSGGELKWHQDYAYWPLAQPNAVTVWIALDHVTLDNGAMQMARGSHLLGERLPAVFGTGAVYFRERRPSVVRPVTEPEQAGLPVDAIELAPGEASIHHALTWHASGANTTDRPRRAAVIRYVADGTRWFGARRYQFNYTDDEVGLRPGDPIGGEYFPLVPRAGILSS
jgi:ectoine hydroxylase-related dioxygenase (phytanoyl-CoA dioxygenase family)